MVSGAGQPLTVNTGQDIQKLYYWTLQQMQDLGLNPSPTTGYYPSEMAGGQAGTYSPTLARQEYQRSLDDANRNYGLDLQRFGLDYANTAFTQQLSAAAQQLQALDLQTRRSGPEDWLRYNHIINNKPAPPAQTVSGAPSAVTPTVTGAPPTAPAGASNAITGIPAPAGGQNTGGPDNDPLAHWFGGLNVAPADRNGIAGQAAKDFYAATPANDGPPAGTPAPASAGNPFAGFDQQQAAQSAAGVNPAAPPRLAFGGESSAMPPLEGDVIPPGASDGPPPAPGGGFIEWLHKLYEADMAQQGGMGGTNAAVVGDPQRPGEPNEELVTSSAPFNVQPLNAMGSGERQQAAALPHKATGGIVDNSAWRGLDPAGVPFVDKENNGGPAFGQRGEDLGVYGKQPLSYANYLQLLPSEQAMTKGLIETPTDQGGYGGYFPDELERARRSAFTGPRDLPYRQSASVGYEA